ncbi:MAG: dihydropteroate synthase [Thermotogae bacterium]|nr:MAG: dihydropteroate synthase [Thermotogota bacterium]
MKEAFVTRVSSTTQFLEKVGVDPASKPIFNAKGNFISLLIYDVPVIAANVIKQEMLASGGDAAVHRNCITHKVDKTHVLTMGTLNQHMKLIDKLRMTPYWGLGTIAEQIEMILNREKVKRIDLPSGKSLNFDRTLIMGIVNVTPDSFYKASRISLASLKDAVAKMIKQGVDIIDVGAESTRPGSERVSEEEELNRAIPAIEEIKKNFDVVVSVDTYKSSVAEEAVKKGADIINDISALRFDPRMIAVASQYQPALIIMHMKGEPKTMQINPYYDDVVKEVLYFFRERFEVLEKAGLKHKIIIDPGIGFGKRLEDNLELLRRIDEFGVFKSPILVGASRKSFIGAVLQDIPLEKRLYGTLAVTAHCVKKGVDIVRVHDVEPNVHVVKMLQSL